MKATRRNVLMGAAPVAVAAGALASSSAPAHAWGVAELDATVPHDPVPHSHVRHNGKHHRVTARFHEEHTSRWPHLAARSHDELKAIALAAARLSKERPLTKDEFDYAQAANIHFKVRRALNVLRGTDHRTFGFEGVDQVHGTMSKFPCGCMTQVVFDSYKAQAGEPYDVHHHAPWAVCDTHKPHAHDFALLYEKATAHAQVMAASLAAREA